MSEYRIVDFAPGCDQETRAHGGWPWVNGKRVRVIGDAPHPHPDGHTILAMVPCDESCPLNHSDKREHLHIFRPNELRYDEN